MNESNSANISSNFDFFSVDRLIDNSVTDFDLFINLRDHFILYSGSGYRWSREELTHLFHAGHTSLYVRKQDVSKTMMYEAIAKLPTVRQDLSPSERIRAIEDLGAKFTQCLFEGEITEACTDKAKLIAQELTDCILEDRSCVLNLGDLAGHDFYTFYHSIRVSAYSVAVAVSLGLSDVQLLREIALGGVLHDVGKRDVPVALLNKSGPLSEPEWSIVRSHPKVGRANIAQSILSHVPREIVLHHHERRSGLGYPDGLDHRSLLTEVQIVTLADIFDALTSARSYQKRRTRFEALDFIKHKLLKDDICPNAFRALVSCLTA